ncbi:hypothetical protein [Micrococcus terreus]|uniref:hypothetical protein n=1 Tax=Micrococcus terreus TaxID=574650 RepID=UPI00301772A2
MERWETMYFEGRRAGFLLRSVQDGVLTTRTAFGGARPGEHRAGPAERFLSESTITLSAEGTVQGWRACTFQDSSATQRVSVDRERAGLDRDALPSHGEWMLLQQLAAQGTSGAEYIRLEESQFFTGTLAPSPARMVRRGAEPVQRPHGQTLVADRVEVLSHGLVLATHWLAGEQVVMSDWGGPAVSVPVDSLAQALEGMDDNMTAFALRGFGF